MSGSGAPDLRVVRGAPDEDELAALTAVLVMVVRRASLSAVHPSSVPARWARPPRYRAPNSWTASPDGR